MTTNWPTLSSKDGPESAYNALHPRLQSWVYEQGWEQLREAQWKSIPYLMNGKTDVVIAAATAAGKTEAAFLPILSSLIIEAESLSPVEVDPWSSHDPWKDKAKQAPTGIEVLCISPLKALINDQFRRIDEMCEKLRVPVHRWHGDVSSSAKQKVLKNPSGVLLITPESLEATFVNRGHEVGQLFEGLQFIVIDEMHSFMSSPRGAQLQSLMNRVELAIRRPVQRVGLSATISDLAAACQFIRPSRPEAVEVVESSARNEVSMQLRGYLHFAPDEPNDDEPNDDEPTNGDSKSEIAKHLFRTLRGSDNLIFANRKDIVEDYADRLRRLCEAARVPNEFWPHHGNLSKEMREDVERHLKDTTHKSTAVCTSTLEMGIDIGGIESVAQIGSPPSVASLKQRLGRSGRGEDPSTLRIYITEKELDPRSDLIDQLRCSTFHATAMTDLMIEHWLEPPEDPGYNYSTLVQQILSTIAQHGGAKADQLFRALCGPGPFHLVDAARFKEILRSLAAEDLIIQNSEGLLLHGEEGERRVNHYDFFAAFETSKEWTLVTGSKTLGSLDISHVIFPGMFMIFGGLRWIVISLDPYSKVIELARASGGRPPSFGGTPPAGVNDHIRREMKLIYESESMRPWLSKAAQEFIAIGRSTYRRLGLEESSVVFGGDEISVFPWRGDRAMFSASMILDSAGIKSSLESVTLTVQNVDAKELSEAITDLLTSKPLDPKEVLAETDNLENEKWDWALSHELLIDSASVRSLDLESGYSILSDLLPHLNI